MARRRRSRRSSSPRGGALGGFLSKDVMATVGGAAAAGFLGPQIGRFLPPSMATSPLGRIASAAVVGAVGYLALKRFNRQAALGFAAAAIAPEVSGAISRGAGGVSGFGEPDGINYLPMDGIEDDDVDMMLSGIDDDDDGIDGLGELDEDTIDISI